MTDYTQNVYFAPKDSLTTGDPNKKIKGTEIDAEFAEIQTAISSKENTANKGIANGYASLDSSGYVPDAQLPATLPRLESSNVFSVGQRIENASPFLLLKETDQSADGKTWRAVLEGAVLYLQALNDAENNGTSFLAVTRAGLTISSIQLTATTVSVTGGLAVTGALSAGATAVASLTIGGLTALTTSSGLNASNINAGTIGAAYVPVGAVTQYQGSLTIAESQISDGSILARIAANETISGNWAFTNAGTITRSGQGRYVYLNGAGNTGGAITLSTSAASGTPANGDIWLQYTA